MKGYKVFNPDFTCLDQKYELGKEFIYDGEIELCKTGFHFCLNPADCFSYYSFDSKNIVCEVECENVSDEIEQDSKRVCSKITIVKQLSWNEVLELVNLGINNTGMKNSGSYNSGSYNSRSYNSGNYNSGNYNSGNRNSGNRNSGNYNSGSNNSGNYNSGFYNSGDYNSGSNNSGNYNSGFYNSGNYNSGYFNSGSYNSGSCNSTDAPMRLFNTILDMSVKEFWSKYTIPICPILTEYKDGKLITYDYKEAWKKAWDGSSEKDRQYMTTLPGFTKENFKEVAGIELDIPEKDCDGTTVEIFVFGNKCQPN
jgi:hypothetical protein